MRSTASARCSGSASSGGSGLRSVSTLQKRQPRVHDLAGDHEGRRAAGPAVVNVRAAGFFANGVQLVFGERVLRGVEDCQRRAARQIDAQPLGQPRARAQRAAVDRSSAAGRRWSTRRFSRCWLGRAGPRSLQKTCLQSNGAAPRLPTAMLAPSRERQRYCSRCSRPREAGLQLPRSQTSATRSTESQTWLRQPVSPSNNAVDR